MAKKSGWNGVPKVDPDNIPADEPIGMHPSALKKNQVETRVPKTLDDPYKLEPQPSSTSSERKTEVGEIIQIPLDLIDDNPYNARVIYNEADIKQLAASILNEGQLQPILVTRNSRHEGRYVSVDGKRRRLAIEQLGKPDIEAKFIDAEDAKKLYLISYTTNEEREQHTDMDNGLAWARLLKEGVYSSQSELARVLGKDRSVLARSMCYSQLPETILDIFRENPKYFSMNIAVEVNGLYSDLGEEIAITFSRKILNLECSQRDVRYRRQKMVEAQEERPSRYRSRRYPVLHGESEIGSIKEWDNGKIVVELTGLSYEKRMEIKKFVEETMKD